jgi:hypothetical protein
MKAPRFGFRFGFGFGFGFRFALAGRSPRSTRGPWGAAGGGRIARRVGRRDAAKVFDRPRMACPKTPTDSRVPSAHGCAEGADEGWPFFWLLFFGHSRESDSGRPKDGPKALALRFERRSDEATKRRNRTEASVELMVGQDPPYGFGRPRPKRSSWWVKTHPMGSGHRGRSGAHGGPGPTLWRPDPRLSARQSPHPPAVRRTARSRPRRRSG